MPESMMLNITLTQANKEVAVILFVPKGLISVVSRDTFDGYSVPLPKSLFQQPVQVNYVMGGHSAETGENFGM